MNASSIDPVTLPERTDVDDGDPSSNRGETSSSTNLDDYEGGYLLRMKKASSYIDASMKKRREEGIMNSLRLYRDALEDLRSSHADLVDHVRASDVAEEGKTNVPKGDDSFLFEDDDLNQMMRKHLELSERALRTCSSSTIVGPGPFYANGMIKNLGSWQGSQDSGTLDNWHDFRVVALNSVKASIAQMER
eukprot:CAMPEP_0184867598 /NCGR_PEP_ID=MMETSP0580-20130426/27216_1 /TAXON_ID=1118495 /ORGANISM="Dactyliosolen fragilissimus" /LENGTH=190 /DNA_ID=CAMNT_0027367985 /DNA_START=111 /DNA_END=679 /DNA_ORIENTATION=+